MKVLLRIFALLLLFTCCTQTEENSVKTDEPEVVLGVQDRARAAVAWNDFMTSSNDAIDSTQRKIDALRAKINGATAKDKVKIRRTINKTEYRLEKLRKELYDHDTWFDAHIQTYTDKNAAKLEAFKTRFKTKLDTINTEIGRCKC